MTTRRGSLVGRNIMSLCAIICLVGILLPDSSLAAPNVAHRPLTKRSFHEIQCKGTFDKSIFAKLDRICQDCYDLYRDPDLYGLCRANCFKTPFFTGCVTALLMDNNKEDFTSMVDTLG